MKNRKIIPSTAAFNLLLFLGIITLSSCLGPHKINKWVAKHYNDAIPATASKKKMDNNYISVISTAAATGSALSTTAKNTSHLLPLLFYWQFDYKNTCTLNAQVPLNNFTNTVMSYNSKTLKQKLNGEKVELTVEQIPNVFAVDDKGHIIWVILYAFGWDYFTVQPQINNMVVSYRVLQADNAEIKRGTITIPDPNKTLALKMFQNLKKKTWEYLDQYDANITTMSKHVIDKLVTEL